MGLSTSDLSIPWCRKSPKKYREQLICFLFANHNATRPLALLCRTGFIVPDLAVVSFRSLGSFYFAGYAMSMSEWQSKIRYIPPNVSSVTGEVISWKL